MTLIMYDAVGIENIPADAEYLAAYIDGPDTYAAVIARFPHNKGVLTISTGGGDADCCDSETGDLTAQQAVMWVERMLLEGRWRPCVYANASRWDEGLMGALAAYGPRIRRWVADWDSLAVVPGGFDAKQYARVGVDGYDASVTLDDFFAATPPPPPPPLPVSWQPAIEAKWCAEWDTKLAPSARPKLRFLMHARAAAIWTLAHSSRPVDWTVRNRGRRFQALWSRLHP